MGKKVAEPKAVVVKDNFKSRKESILSRCEQGGVIQPYLNDIKNTKNDDELNDVLMINVELRPFMEA